MLPTLNLKLWVEFLMFMEHFLPSTEKHVKIKNNENSTLFSVKSGDKYSQ